MNPTPDPLDPVLDRWEAPAHSRNLAPEVWRRIQEEEASRGPFSGFLDNLTRPSFAALFAACCVFLGLFLAEVRINHEQRRRGALLAQSYIQLIDPLLRSSTGGVP
ncbi:MAG TPA: hypothetical protein VGF85_09705 [Opitutaceae bacterium]|jgi:hypothetical protein